MHAYTIGADVPGMAAPERPSSLKPVCLAPLGTAGAAAAGIDPPESETARVSSASRIGGQGPTDEGDSDGSTAGEQAALIIEGEDYAREYLARLHGGIVETGELAVIISFLTGEMLHGACRLIERALGVPHA